MTASHPPENRYRDPESPQARFLEEVEDLRPKLHRYCTRMLRSALDGEDVVQDTLAAAFFRLDMIDPSRPLSPLLYRIAHNRCIDLLRRRKFESDEEPSDRSDDQDLERATILDQQARIALEHLVNELAPRERSCFLLKDVLEHTLEETAQIIGCKTGAVKSALHRARTKLASLEQLEARSVAPDPAKLALLERYAVCFNQRDWPRLSKLLTEDLRLDVVGVLEDVGTDVLYEDYRSNYARLDGSWRLVVGLVDDEPVLLCLRRYESDAEEVMGWPIRVDVRGERIAGLRDYVLQARLLTHARVELLC